MGEEVTEKEFFKALPEVPEELDWVYTAFWRLQTGEGRISYVALDRYAERHGIDDFEEFVTLINVLEGVYARHLRDQRKAKGK